MITKEQITAALKKLGPVSPGELADHLEVERTAIGYHLKKLLDAGELKAAGKANARRVALPDQTFETADAPPQQRKKKKSTARATKPSKKARTPRAPKTPPAAPAARDFLTAITADSRLVIVNGAMAPLIFSEKESEQIAELCLAHFEG